MDNESAKTPSKRDRHEKKTPVKEMKEKKPTEEEGSNGREA
jgi:hypothetical protein